MEIIGNIITVFNTVKEFIANHAVDILSVIGAVYTIALVIVKMTPSQADDEILDKVYKFILGIIGKLGIKK